MKELLFKLGQSYYAGFYGNDPLMSSDMEMQHAYNIGREVRKRRDAEIAEHGGLYNSKFYDFESNYYPLGGEPPSTKVMHVLNIYGGNTIVVADSPYNRETIKRSDYLAKKFGKETGEFKIVLSSKQNENEAE